MCHPMSVAASLPLAAQKSLAIKVFSKTESIEHLAAQNQVSWKFLFQQGQKANEALDITYSSATAKAPLVPPKPLRA